MSDDALHDRRHTHEDDYFRKRDRELVDKIRRAAAVKQAHADIGAKTGLADPAAQAELHALGFTPDTVVLLPLVPVIETAWADGGVSAAERALIVELARSRGVTEGGAADRQLTHWLDRQPAPAVFTGARRLIAALFEGGAPADLRAADLIKYCEDIAAASGGVFGFAKVSESERVTLERIAAAFKSRP
jgi:hypothetical protein